MTNDFNSARVSSLAIAVMKFEFFSPERIPQLDLTSQLAIVIAGDADDLALGFDTFQQLS